MRSFLLFSLLLVTTSTSAPAQADKDKLLHRLRNMTYLHPTDGDSASLRDGELFEDYGEGGVVVLWLEQVAFGDIDGVGKGDAAVVLVWHGGGSGTFYNIAAVLDVTGEARPVAATPLSDRSGDRVEVDSVWIYGGLIQVEMVRHTEWDGLAGPSLHITNQYQLDEDLSLVELDIDPYEDEVIWQLRRLAYADATDAPFADLPANIELRTVYQANGWFYWGHHACSVWTYQSLPSDGWPRWERIRYGGTAPDSYLVECSSGSRHEATQ